MGFMGGLGSFAGGMSQGMQSGQEMQQRALQIKQMQMQLDQQKRDFAARMAAAQGWGQGGQGGGPGGPPGGGAPMGLPQQGPQAGPMPPQQPGGMPGQMPGGQGPQMPPQMMQGQPPQGMPGPGMGGGGPPQMGAGGPPRPPGGMAAGGGQQPPTDPYSTLMRIAGNIRAHKPDIDPETLYSAVEQTIGLMKGLAPDYRAEMSAMLAAQREADTHGDRQTHEGDERTWHEQSNALGQQRIAASVQNTQARIADGDKKLTYLQDRIDARAKDRNADKVQTRVLKDRGAELRNELARNNSKVSALMGAGADQDKIDAANADVQKTFEKIGLLEKSVTKADQGRAQQPAPQQKSAAAPKGATRLMGPDGKPYYVPNDRVDAFIAAGGHP